jgi:prepilin-type processing-associated H-X9-DG protein
MDVTTKRSNIRFSELGAILALVILAILIAMPTVRATMEGVDRRTCQDNLRRWGMIFDMYINENHWYYPYPHGFETATAPDKVAGCTNLRDDFDFFPELRQIFPDYANDRMLMVCPDGPYWVPESLVGGLVVKKARPHPTAFGIVDRGGDGPCALTGAISNPDASYTYLGYIVDRADDGNLMVSREQARRLGLPAEGPAQIVVILTALQPTPERDEHRIMAERGLALSGNRLLGELGPPFDRSVGFEGNDFMNPMNHSQGDGSGIFVGYREKVSRPWWERTPVMWDTIYRDAAGEPVFVHQDPDGVNVLFMDGHVEFRTYPGRFPVSKAFISTRRVP